MRLDESHSREKNDREITDRHPLIQKYVFFKSSLVGVGDGRAGALRRTLTLHLRFTCDAAMQISYGIKVIEVWYEWTSSAK